MQIVQGPPGTGKTRLISMMCLSAIEQEKLFMVVARTNYAVEVCAQRIASALHESSSRDAVIFAIDRASLSGLASDVTASAGSSSALAGSSPPPLTSSTRNKSLDTLAHDVNPSALSLSSYIRKRLRSFQNGETIESTEENKILEALDDAKTTHRQTNQNLAESIESTEKIRQGMDGCC